jgi:hypothetical protein
MKRATLVGALSFATALLPSPGLAIEPPDRTEPAPVAGSVIAFGRVSDHNGQPLPGEVRLYAWPDQSAVQVGDEFSLVPVARAPVGPGGSFALLAAPTPQLVQLARPNDGHLNLVLQAVAGGRIQHHSFSSYMEATDLSTFDQGEVAWTARSDEPAAPLDIQVGKEAPRMAVIQPAAAQGATLGNSMSWSECPDTYKLLDRKVSSTVVGEFHSDSDTSPESYFHYGQSADTDVSVGVKYSGKNWTLSGEHHVGNQRKKTVGKDGIGSNFHAQMVSDFAYGRYEAKSSCGLGSHEEIRPIEWLSGSDERFYPAPGCNLDDSERTRKYGPGHFFTRKEQRAERWSGAAEVFGVSLSAQSGYSKWVESHWRFGTNEQTHYLCGSNGDPDRASRIFAGLPEPRVDCRKGKPC